MCKLIFRGLFIVFAISACVGQKRDLKNGKLMGSIGIYEGNCMPGPGITPCEPNPISTAVLITELNDKYDQEKVITKIISGEDGKYEATLPVGNYSLFLQDDDQVVCAVLECPTTCFCQPFKITADSTTVVDANLDHAVW